MILKIASEGQCRARVRSGTRWTREPQASPPPAPASRYGFDGVLADSVSAGRIIEWPRSRESVACRRRTSAGIVSTPGTSTGQRGSRAWADLALDSGVGSLRFRNPPSSSSTWIPPRPGSAGPSRSVQGVPSEVRLDCPPPRSGFRHRTPGRSGRAPPKIPVATWARWLLGG